MERQSWDASFMDIAWKVSTRATCLGRQVGAVLVQDRGMRGTGYNGRRKGCCRAWRSATAGRRRTGGAPALCMPKRT